MARTKYVHLCLSRPASVMQLAISEQIYETTPDDRVGCNKYEGAFPYILMVTLQSSFKFGFRIDKDHGATRVSTERNEFVNR